MNDKIYVINTKVKEHFVLSQVVFNVKHTKYKKKCAFACARGGGGARNPPGSQGGASLEKFGNHCFKVIEKY